MNNFKKSIYRISDSSLPSFVISSSVVSSGTGTLDITNGQPSEVISLSFSVTQQVGVFDSLSFTSPVTISGSLDSLHLSRTGTMTLNGGGSGSSTYTFDPLIGTSTCLVTVTARSSGLLDGIGNSTNIV